MSHPIDRDDLKRRLLASQKAEQPPAPTVE